jgi:hypothetical protein
VFAIALVPDDGCDVSTPPTSMEDAESHAEEEPAAV